MIEFELPCCGAPVRLSGLADEVRCDDCAVVVAVAPDDVPARVATGVVEAAPLAALAA